MLSERHKDIVENAFNKINNISLVSLGLMKNICPKCHIIFDFSESVIKCPLCGLSNGQKYADFGIYPIISAVDVLYNIIEIHHLAKLKQDYIIRKIQNSFRERLNLEIEYNKIKQIFVKSCNLNHEDSDYFERLKTAVVKIHNFDGEELTIACDFFISGDNCNRLYKSIVFLTATLIEILFKDYMSQFLTQKINSTASKKIMKMLTYKSIDDHIAQLNVFFEKNLQYEINSIEPHYYERWMELKDKRNSIIHKNDIDISSKQADELIKFVKKSVFVFANLSNKIYGHDFPPEIK